MPPVDQAAVTGQLGEEMAASLRWSVSTGIWGWFDDDIAFTLPWGFDLASVRVPVAIWQGGQDLMVPKEHGPWLAAHIPTAVPHLAPDEGHISLVAQIGTGIAQVRDWLDHSRAL